MRYHLRFAKPRLRLVRGIWTCRSVMRWPGHECQYVGDGYSPKEAYDEWVRDVNMSMFHGKHMHG